MSNRSIIKRFAILRTTLAILLAFIIIIIIIALVSSEPMNAYRNFFAGPVSTISRFGSLMETMQPLIFAGIACVVMFETGVFSLGVEGCFFFGAYWGAVVACQSEIGQTIHPLIAVVAGGIAGLVIASIPTALRLLFGVDAFVSSLLLNYGVLHITTFLLKKMILSETAYRVASVEFQDSAMLTKLIPNTRITTGIFIALICVLLIYFLHTKTKYGLEARTVGGNSKFAEALGIRTNRVIWISQLLGGFISGIGGAVQMLSVYTHFDYSVMPGYGFAGIIVCTISGAKPALIPLAAFFMAYIQTGADIVGRMNDVPSEIVSVLLSIVVVLVVAKGFLENSEHRYLLKTKNLAEVSD